MTILGLILDGEMTIGTFKSANEITLYGTKLQSSYVDLAESKSKNLRVLLVDDAGTHYTLIKDFGMGQLKLTNPMWLSVDYLSCQDATFIPQKKKNFNEN